MDRNQWLTVCALATLIMSSMYVGAFIWKHQTEKDAPVVIHAYRGKDHQIEKIHPKSRRIVVWPFVDIEYDR
jgi:hypothetical protein